jgi:hypothetical protein
MLDVGLVAGTTHEILSPSWVWLPAQLRCGCPAPILLCLLVWAHAFYMFDVMLMRTKTNFFSLRNSESYGNWILAVDCEHTWL